MTKYVKVEVSAETKEQADNILSALLSKKLIAGSIVTSAPARFWWKGDIVDMNYYTISAFSISKHNDAITETVEALSIEEIPLVWFYEIDGSEKSLKWISDSLL